MAVLSFVYISNGKQWNQLFLISCPIGVLHNIKSLSHKLTSLSYISSCATLCGMVTDYCRIEKSGYLVSLISWRSRVQIPLLQLSYFYGNWSVSDQEMLNLKISMVTCIKWFLSYYKTATVFTVWRKTHKIYTQPSIQGRLLANMVDWWVSWNRHCINTEMWGWFMGY